MPNHGLRAITVGFVPWMLSTAIYVTLLSTTGGLSGTMIALRDVFTSPMIVLPLLVGGAYLLAEPQLAARFPRLESRRWLGGAIFGVVAGTLTALVGLVWSGLPGLSWLTAWGAFSGYFIFVGVAAGITLGLHPVGSPADHTDAPTAVLSLEQ